MKSHLLPLRCSDSLLGRRSLEANAMVVEANAVMLLASDKQNPPNPRPNHGEWFRAVVTRHPQDKGSGIDEFLHPLSEGVGLF